MKRSAYIWLDGYAGRTRLTGTVIKETEKRRLFVPDRDCYQFRKGVKRWCKREHCRFQYVQYVGAEDPE